MAMRKVKAPPCGVVSQHDLCYDSPRCHFLADKRRSSCVTYS